MTKRGCARVQVGFALQSRASTGPMVSLGMAKECVYRCFVIGSRGYGLTHHLCPCPLTALLVIHLEAIKPLSHVTPCRTTEEWSRVQTCAHRALVVLFHKGDWRKRLVFWSLPPSPGELLVCLACVLCTVRAQTLNPKPRFFFASHHASEARARRQSTRRGV